MKFKTRRLGSDVTRLVGRTWPDVQQGLQEFLEKLWAQVSGGVPPGFNGLVPPPVQAGNTGSAGAESSGWMSASASPPVVTGVAAGLANDNAEGVGTALMRADAHIKRDVRVKTNGVDVGTRNAVNFLDTTGASFAGVDDGGGDKVDISITVSGGGDDAEFLAWMGL